jgi:hypothetical protein
MSYYRCTDGVSWITPAEMIERVRALGFDGSGPRRARPGVVGAPQAGWR